MPTHASRARPHRAWLALAITLVTALLPAASRAADFAIFLDEDADAATGCTAPGGFAGFEQRLTTHVDEASASVTAIVVATCSSGVFAGAATGPESLPIPLGVGAGDLGSQVIETYLAASLLAVPEPATVRVLVVGDDGSPVTDVVGPFTVALASAVEIPTASGAALAVLALLLLVAALAVLRRRRAVALALLLLVGAAGSLWALVTLDGSPNDWGPQDQRATDATPESPAGADVVSVYLREDTCGATPGLCLRIDARLAFNHAPVAANDQATADGGAPVVLHPLANDVDADGDALSVSVGSNPLHGTLVVAGDGSATYTPDAAFAHAGGGPDSFSYTAVDVHGAVSNVATVTIAVGAVNQAPTLAALATPGPSGTFSIALAASDADGDILTVFVSAAPTHGTCVLNPDGSATYTPDPVFAHAGGGPDAVTFSVTDGHGGSDSEVVTVIVAPVNQAPVAAGVTLGPPAPLTRAISGQMQASDPDGDALTFTVTAPPTNGTVVPAAGGAFVYTPNVAFLGGTDSFTWIASDGQADSGPQVVNLDVPPLASSP